MKFIPDLAITNRLGVPVKVAARYEVWSGPLGKRFIARRGLDTTMVAAIRREGAD
jgi:hypothetical protein